MLGLAVHPWDGDLGLADSNALMLLTISPKPLKHPVRKYTLSLGDLVSKETVCCVNGKENP